MCIKSNLGELSFSINGYYKRQPKRRGKRRKKKNKGLNRRKDTLIKKAYELREFDGIHVALIICKHDRYTTYRSKDHAS